jgi:hypothetical protein
MNFKLESLAFDGEPQHWTGYGAGGDAAHFVHILLAWEAGGIVSAGRYLFKSC